MNTIFHVLDEDTEVVVSVLLKAAPEIVLGSEPAIGKSVWIKIPMCADETQYEIVGIAEENEEEHGVACALRLKPVPILYN